MWVTSKKWGLDGRLLHMSYGQSSLYLVMTDGEGKQVQGGVVKVPLKLLTGVSRARFSDRDGQLYITGLRGWQTNAPRDGAFQRIRYTGKPIASVTGLKVVKGGIELTFSQKLEAKSAADAENYTGQQWNYLWCSNYGSRDYKTGLADFGAKVREYNKLRREKKNAEAQKLLKEFETGRDPVKITKASLSEDGRTVTLSIPDLKPVMQMNMKYRIKTEEAAVQQEIYNTINRVP